MAVLKMQKYGGQFMLSVPQAYVHIYGIKPGDLYEISRTKDGFRYRRIEEKDIVSRAFGKPFPPRHKKIGEGETKL